MTEVATARTHATGMTANNSEARLREVLNRAVLLVPGHAGAELLRLADAGALASMAAVTMTWVGAHLFGVGEIADVVLLSVGYLALGGVALQAGEALYRAIVMALNATSSSDYDNAAQDLAKAISLIGVQTTLGILMRQKPNGLFKSQYWQMDSLKVFSKYQLPRNGGRRYTPKLTFVSNEHPGWGVTTTWTGDMQVSTAGTHEDRLLAIYHERVHSFLVPKLYFLRNLRCHIAMSGYSRSYLLRYLEEALAETIAQVRVHGLQRQNLLAGIQFPLRHGVTYKMTLAVLEEEVRGIVYGPINVAGTMYRLYRGACFEDE